ncbi:MAG: hypothetical protein M1829_000579 [Trizodia sp. TS-e1964]|nr:MAG: hypothetical protein M1829_000579 [Trizodia sp. TS-e1964]
MPSTASLNRQVVFDQPTISRQPKEAEHRTLLAFSRHAGRCEECNIASRILCDRGRSRALAVTEYVYLKAGQVYSASDRKDGYQPVQLEIPYGCEPVRDLLAALERGLRQRSQQEPAVVSYDRTNYVAPRTVELRPVVEIATSARPGRAVERVKLSRRGSLYPSDIRERQSRVQQGYYADTYHQESRRDLEYNEQQPRFYR